MFKYVNHCRCCGGTNLTKFVDLGEQPLANNFHTGDSGEVYPLEVMLCQDCFHSQLSVSVQSELMFDDYVYRSGTSTSLSQYFEYLAQMIDFNHAPEPDVDHPAVPDKKRTILDIGSNDGTFLRYMKSLGWKTFGIDPAHQFTGVSDIVGYWSTAHAKGLGPFNVITALNVFAHTDDLDDFLLACKMCLHPAGRLYIQTSQRDWITNGEFDTIQHEHQNFFTVNSMARLLLRHGLVIDNIDLPDVHGSSYVFSIKFQKGQEYHSPSAENVFLYEKDLGLYELETYTKYGRVVEETIDDLNSIITDYAMDDWKVIGYGAATKGNILINAASELSFYLDYIIDDNEWKQGLLSPGGDTPVVHPTVLNVESGKLLIVILAWNMKDEIIQRIKDMVAFEVEDVHFLTVFPNLKLETYDGEPVK